jgi:4-hydroxy-tetrahydrodipicolinate synthase
VTAHLRGSYTPLVTPFSEDGSIRWAAFEASVEYQCAEGSAGVVVTGTTGEPTSLTLDERRELFSSAVAVADSRLEVVAATGSASHEETLRLTEEAESAGVAAVLVVVPAFARPSQRGLVDHFTRVAKSTSLPVLLYNIPGRAGTAVTAETVEQIATACDNVVGLKQAAPDLDLITTLLTSLGDDFRIFCGLESYSYPMLALGAAGLMSAVGNLLPRAVADLCAAVTEGDHAQALELHRALFPVNQAVFFDTNPVPLKHMLAVERLESVCVRPPLVRLSEEDAVHVERAIALTRERLSAALAG